jgi:hypothetical protein
MSKFKIKELNRLTNAYSYTGNGYILKITYDDNDDKCIEIENIKNNRVNEFRELVKSKMMANFNDCRIEKVEINYQLALLTYYTTINNKLNKMCGDQETLNKVKDLFDNEMDRIVNMLNCRVLTLGDIQNK